MKVRTKAYGDIDIDERQKLMFPDGLFGFENLKDYVLLDGETTPFFWLQSLDSRETAFVLVDPFLFCPDYEMDISDDELAKIGLKSPENMLFFSILTIPADNGPMTANLQGPIIINRDTRLAKQVVLSDTRWKTKHNVQEELAKSKKAPC
ncbi:MAG: flagellar assembly protein FliW [Spirochaetaceae bacterium]|nr:flagellar assembly protein FliW [Spirochaetaceae bacterium]